jgi:hypothetical protein
MPPTGAIAPKILACKFDCLKAPGSRRKLSKVAGCLVLVFVFPPPTLGAKPDMAKIGEFGFRVNFDPSFINGLFKAVDVFTSIAVDALNVDEGKAKRGGTACGPQNASERV